MKSARFFILAWLCLVIVFFVGGAIPITADSLYITPGSGTHTDNDFFAQPTHLTNTALFSNSKVITTGQMTMSDPVLIPITPTPDGEGYSYFNPNGTDPSYLIYSSGTYTLGEGFSTANSSAIEIKASNVSLDGNGQTITGSGLSSIGVNIKSRDVTVKNFAGITKFTTGIYSVGDRSSITNNNVSYNTNDGINCDRSNTNIEIVGNTASYNSDDGIIFNGTNVSIMGNNASNNRYMGMVGGGTNVTIMDNTVSYNNLENIVAFGNNVIIKGNTANGCLGNNGISFDYGTNVTITGNNVSYNHNWGILSSETNVNNVIITGNNASNNEYGGGIYSYSTNTTIAGNIASNNYHNAGILSGGNNASISENTIYGNSYDGIEILDNIIKQSITDNKIYNNTRYGLLVYSNHAGGNGIIYNNYFSNTNNVGNYNGVLFANISQYFWTNLPGPQLGTNVVGGPYIAGNYWSNPNGTGCSDLQPANANGYTTIPYQVAPEANDTFPLVRTTHSGTHTINATAGTGGSISPSGAVTVVNGSNQSFTFTPDSGYQIATVTIDGQSASTVSPYTFSNVTADHTISVNFTTTNLTYIINATAGPGGNISPSGLVRVFAGYNQSFSITSLPCYNISDIVINNSVNLGPQTSPFLYTFTNVTANQSIEVQYTRLQYPITATAGTGGSISPSGVVPVPCGSDQLFTITPSTNYALTSVQVDGQRIGTPITYTFTNVTTSHQISANFTQIPGQHRINSTANEWSLIVPKGNNTYYEFSNQSFISQAKPGSSLADVQVDNSSVGAIGYWTFTNITADHSIHAIGNPIQDQIHVYFNAIPRYGEMPLSVTFSDQSLGTPTSWYWQFGDGINATTQNPQHIYTIPGVYTVTLRAKNAQSGGYGVWSNCITVTSGPVPQPTPTPVPGEIVPNFSASQTQGNPPLSVQFTDLSTGNPTSWIWDFGDGKTAILQNPLHVYSTSGTYPVTMLAQNSHYSGTLTVPNQVVIS
jgi:PKD repeat protein